MVSFKIFPEHVSIREIMNPHKTPISNAAPASWMYLQRLPRPT
jgi:hypothetical protein